jgi:hypothetical protein
MLQISRYLNIDTPKINIFIFFKLKTIIVVKNKFNLICGNFELIKERRWV